MDAETLAKTKSQMHSFAMGEAMAQAARDYQSVRWRGGGQLWGIRVEEVGFVRV